VLAVCCSALLRRNAIDQNVRWHRMLVHDSQLFRYVTESASSKKYVG